MTFGADGHRRRGRAAAGQQQGGQEVRGLAFLRHGGLRGRSCEAASPHRRPSVHGCMLHELTAVRSSRALRLWSASQFLRPSASERSRRRLLSMLEHVLQCTATGAAHGGWHWPRALLLAYRHGAPCKLHDANGRLMALVVLHIGHYLRCPACGRWVQCRCCV